MFMVDRLQHRGTAVALDGLSTNARAGGRGRRALVLEVVSPERLLDESPWLQFYQRMPAVWTPPCLNNWPCWAGAGWGGGVGAGVVLGGARRRGGGRGGGAAGASRPGGGAGERRYRGGGEPGVSILHAVDLD
jgi:hypothetical protein